MASKVRLVVLLGGVPYAGSRAVQVLGDIYADYKTAYMPQDIKKLPRWKRATWIVEHVRYPFPVELKIWREPRHANPRRSPYVRELRQLGVRRKKNGRGTRNTIR